MTTTVTDDAARAVTNGGIEIRPAAVDAETWNGYVEQSRQGTAFHYRQFLDVVADHADATVHKLVGYKGQEPVGLFPVFEIRKGPVTTAFSPPPNMGLSQMGPAMLNLGGMKRRREEKRVHRFVEAGLEWIDRVVAPSYVHVRTHHSYGDHRPFIWNGFDLSSRYTYVVDLSPGADEVIGEFSSDARRNVRRTDDDDYRIEERGAGAVGAVIDHVDRRHRRQGLDFPVTAAFVGDLFDRLPDGTIRAYVCEVDGEYASGMITLEDDRTVYRWEGGARPLHDVDVPVNDLLDWRVITDAIDRGRTQYDLLGANTPQLCDYKSKFGPELVSYQAAESGTRTMRLFSRLYRRLH
ncbi:MAG: GNAT family N-acetyltransferase [Haloferacaceae archaeon]